LSGAPFLKRTLKIEPKLLYDVEFDYGHKLASKVIVSSDHQTIF
jgi:hypothetical protein